MSDMYQTVVALMGEPNTFAGMILLYLFAFLLVVFVGSLATIIVLSVLKRLLCR